MPLAKHSWYTKEEYEFGDDSQSDYSKSEKDNSPIKKNDIENIQLRGNVSLSSDAPNENIEQISEQQEDWSGPTSMSESEDQ